MASRRIFLLSPANTSGERTQLLLNPRAAFPLARALHGPTGAPLGLLFSFGSGLYFRGKLTYALHFGRPPQGVPPALVITSSRGLVPPETLVRPDDLREFGAVPIDPAEPRYREPLSRSASALAARSRGRWDVVLLGSIASDKYVGILLDAFGDALLFPAAFVGRGDMSRGGLLLRAVDADTELEYAPVGGARRRGIRPPRLAPRRRPEP